MNEPQIRNVQIGVYLTPYDILRFEQQRLKMRPVPTRSTLALMIIMDWVEAQEKKKK